MGNQKKTGKGRLDKYYHLAKSQGYRARSAFKLIQLNKKYGFLEKARVLVDLCAAPGGWLQVATKYMPVSSIIVGVDLAPIKPIPRVITHVEDITTPSCQSSIQKDLKTWKADVVLHDGAPNVGRSWIQDAYDQSTLVLSALKLAVDLLAKGGTFVTKVFRSRDYNKLLWVLGLFFEKVEATKPPSSRNVSAELFVVCRGFLAPKKIDPKVLDPKYVFQEVDDIEMEADDRTAITALTGKTAKTAMTEILNPVKTDLKRKRDGYEEGNNLLFKKISVLEYLRVPKNSEAIQMLASFNQMTFEDTIDSILAAEMNPDADKSIRSQITLDKVLNNPLTTPEIHNCLQDLKVLGRKEYKMLLKWRKNVRKLLIPSKIEDQKDDQPETAADGEEQQKEVTEIEILDELVAKQELDEKRKKKKKLEKLAKDRKRVQLNMITPTDIIQEDDLPSTFVGHDDEEINVAGSKKTSLFDLRLVKNMKSQDVDHVDEDYSESDEEFDQTFSENEDLDSDYDRYNEMEDNLDENYNQFMEKQIQKDPKLLVKKKRAMEEEFTGTKDSDDSDTSEVQDNVENFEESDDDSISNDFVEERQPKIDASKTRKAEQFFKNQIFEDADIDIESDISEDESKVKQQRDKKQPKEIKQKLQMQDDESDVDLNEKEELEKQKRADKIRKTLDSPQAIQIALDLIKNRRENKDSVIDDYGFTRHSNFGFDDPNLPSWFKDDELRFNMPVRHQDVTKEAVQIYKERQKALDNKPIKKVLEAKARKKMKATKKLDNLKKKMNNILESDLNDKNDASAYDPEMASKLSEMQKMMRNAIRKQKESQKKKVEVVVAKGVNRGNKGRPKGIKGRYKMVDGRMKKEVRAQKRKEQKKKR